MTPRKPNWRSDGPAGSASTVAPGNNDLVVAIRLADQFRHRSPTLAELMDDHGMSKATAYRWLQHFRQARPGSAHD